MLLEVLQAINIILTVKPEALLKIFSEHGVMGSTRICKHMQIYRARVNQLILSFIKAGIAVMDRTTRAVKDNFKEDRF
jgi:hypothetical protein